MKKIFLLLTVMLQGCYDDVSDIQQYMNDVKNGAPVKIDPIPEVKEFVHVDYEALISRSPFELPSPEAIEENYIPVQNCLAPDPRRRKQPLEKFALDNLSMKGTLGTDNQIWALIEATDGSLHRVTNDNFIGLFNGRITSVTDNQVELIELIPDGAGCWKERTATVLMAEDTAEE